MDRWEAQYAFWASFGVPAYEENSVPDRGEISYPYITFQKVLTPFYGRTVVNPSVWTRSPSWAEADALALSIFERTDGGGAPISFDGGSIQAYADENNFAQSMGDPEDDLIKRYRLSVILDFS